MAVKRPVRREPDRPAARAAKPAAAPPLPPAPPLLRDPWAWLAPLGVLPLLARCIGAPLGEPVAEDFDFLHRALILGTGTLLDGGGSQAFWRPIPHQSYYWLFGRAIVEHPGAVAAFHVFALALGALLFYRVAREALPGPAAAVAASFPLLAESTRTLVGWPTQFVDVGLYLFSALALHEASRRRLPTALVALLAALLNKELAVITALLMPLVPGPLARRDRIRLAAGAGAVAAVWAVAYLSVRHAAHLELPHGLERDPSELAVPLGARLAWAFGGSVRAILSLTLMPGRHDALAFGLVGLLLVAAGGLFATSAAARARLAALRAPVAWGLAWFVLYTASLATIYPLWQPNRSQIGSAGLGVATAAVLGAAHPLLPAAFVATRIGLLALAPAPATNISNSPPETGAFMDFERLTRLQRFMREMRALLEAHHPTLPHGSAIVRGSMPHGLVYAFGGDRAVQVWYRDSTLRLISSATFREHPEIAAAASVQFQPGHAHDLVLLPIAASRAQEDAYLALVAKRFDEAIRLYARAESLETDSLAYVFHAENLGGHAFALEMLERPDEAVPIARRALALYPKDVNARLVLASDALVHGRFDEGERWIDALLADDPNLRSALQLQSLLRQARGGR